MFEHNESNQLFRQIIGVIVLAFIVISSLMSYFMLVPLWFLVELFYYKSKKFQSIKNDVSKYVDDCNKLNEHIEGYKKYESLFSKEDLGSAELIDDSNHNFQRKELSNYRNNHYTYNCSLSVCRRAQTQPFIYLCKYFNIRTSEETLSKVESMLNNFSSIEDGKKLLDNKRKEILKNIQYQIPLTIRIFRKKALMKKLGFNKVDFKSIYFPTYTFSYISAGGNASLKTNIMLDIPNLNDFIAFLDSKIKYRKSIKGQRSLMTSKLRDKIKARDEYTCLKCSNSISREPNLLLEIDHKIPLSKGGMTEETNLQTLCWRCNRSKGSKIEQS